MSAISAVDHNICLLGYGGLVAGRRVAVSPSVVPIRQIGLLQGPDASAPEAVQICPDPGVPAGWLCVSRELAAQLAIQEGRLSPWSLSWDRLPVVEAVELVMESTSFEAGEALALELRASVELTETVLYLPAEASVRALALPLGDRLYQARLTLPPGTSFPVLTHFGSSTRVRLFCSVRRRGVDVVILADCSGSMDVPDMATGGDSTSWESPSAALTRMEAVKRALRSFLARRLTTEGRPSNFALLGFTEQCQQRFPRQGGMAMLDANSTSLAARDFREAIEILRARQGSFTHIGRALEAAADLIYAHGNPDNERLIVLLSDGAENVMSGEDRTGEVVDNTDDTVAVASQLYQGLGIRIQPIGVSSGTVFERWYRSLKVKSPPRPGLAPDHELLRQIGIQAGGEPARTGDAEVLEGYFGELGEGTAWEITLPRAPRQTPMQREEIQALSSGREQLREALEVKGATQELDSLGEEIFDLYELCNTLSGQLAQSHIFKITHGAIAILRQIGRPTTSEQGFHRWVVGVHQVFVESLPKHFRDRKPGTSPGGTAAVKDAYAAERVAELIHGQVLDEIFRWRNHASHDKSAELDRDNLSPGDRKQWEVLAQARQTRVGQRAIRPDDARAWCALQTSYLRDLRDVLADLVDAFESATHAPTQPPERADMPYIDIQM